MNKQEEATTQEAINEDRTRSEGESDTEEKFDLDAFLKHESYDEFAHMRAAQRKLEAMLDPGSFSSTQCYQHPEDNSGVPFLVVLYNKGPPPKTQPSFVDGFKVEYHELTQRGDL